MGIKSLITADEEEEKEEYPCIKKSNLGQIVLFVAPRTGTVLNQGTTGSTIGKFTEAWAESSFGIFNGVVELSNNNS